ncbi:DUF99 family protein [Methanonatronarchaeum sp. AMET6-2]|uniref:endonuclease dU n=1 Tax=Methanonatronarchaeum sp. AMET6-2 TaxID=2933293 RepID=UPI0012035ACF|nr:DUF99 family protein [Methanonatronarchaeum sp. AMET6-2]RZN62103.1 MAG: DUF99 family protein [Methanonatronarchaeia archaeon]UOY10206.1 DUF99 family protein [Methanonatronarchaeum sp. AMET6-2]
MNIKGEIRVLGVDDGPYQKQKNKETLVVGTVFRGGSWLDGVIRTNVEVDGLEATEKIGQMILNSKHHDQIRVIFLDGVTYGGMNTVDIQELHETTDKPVVVVSRKKPDFKEIKKALKNLPNPEKRWRDIKNAGKPHKVKTTQKNYEKPVYIQYTGIEKQYAAEITRHTSTRSRIPEPIRAAHIISTGIMTGDSHGGA